MLDRVVYRVAASIGLASLFCVYDGILQKLLLLLHVRACVNASIKNVATKCPRGDPHTPRDATAGKGARTRSTPPPPLENLNCFWLGPPRRTFLFAKPLQCWHKAGNKTELVNRDASPKTICACGSPLPTKLRAQHTTR